MPPRYCRPARTLIRTSINPASANAITNATRWQISSSGSKAEQYIAARGRPSALHYYCGFEAIIPAHAAPGAQIVCNSAQRDGQ
jgi:hypothetical protein